MSIFGLTTGFWWIECPSDARWNSTGHGVVGGFVCPPDAKLRIEELSKTLGIEKPADLEYGYHKD